MATGENRQKVTGTDGKTYWWNPNTQKLFYSKSGTQQVPPNQVGGLDQSGNMTIIPPAGNATPGPGGRGTGENRQQFTGADGKTYFANLATGNLFDEAGNFIQQGGFSILDGVLHFLDPNNPNAGAPDFEPPPAGQGDTPTPGEPLPGEEPEEEIDLKGQEDLRAILKGVLDQFGLATPGLLVLIERAVREDWSETRFIQEMRQHPDYLANPIFAANIEAANQGRRFRSEAELIAEADAIRTLVKRYGYGDIPDSYIAANVLSGKSLAEIDHLIGLQRQIETFGPVFRGFVEQEMGIILTDEDLFEIFDPERDTHEFDEAFRAAQYRARPFTLGLGIRSAAEQRALEMLGVDPEEAFKRFEQVAFNAPRFERLASIESMISGNLPGDFGSFLTGVDNGLLVRALVFNDPQAVAELQAMTAREIGRWNVGGGAAANQQSQLVGLLPASER